MPTFIGQGAAYIHETRAGALCRGQVRPAAGGGGQVGGQVGGVMVGECQECLESVTERGMTCHVSWVQRGEWNRHRRDRTHQSGQVTAPGRAVT